MSSDKHRSLARRIAWLRWCSSTGEDGQLKGCHRATGIKGLPHITEDLVRLEAEGLMVRSRTKIGFFGRHGYATTFAASPKGIVFLKETLARRGADFGPVSLVRSTQSDRPNKKERAGRHETLMDRRLKREARRKRQMAFVAAMEFMARRPRPKTGLAAKVDAD